MLIRRYLQIPIKDATKSGSQIYFPHNDIACWGDRHKSVDEIVSCCSLGHDTALCGMLPPALRVESARDTILLRNVLNHLTPNDAYRGRTASLTSKVANYLFIQQI